MQIEDRGVGTVTILDVKGRLVQIADGGEPGERPLEADERHQTHSRSARDHQAGDGLRHIRFGRGGHSKLRQLSERQLI